MHRTSTELLGKIATAIKMNMYILVLLVITGACAAPVNRVCENETVSSEVSAMDQFGQDPLSPSMDLKTSMEPQIHHRRKRHITDTNNSDKCPTGYVWVTGLSRCITAEDYKNLIEDDYVDQNK